MVQNLLICKVFFTEDSKLKICSVVLLPALNPACSLAIISSLWVYAVWRWLSAWLCSKDYWGSVVLAELAGCPSVTSVQTHITVSLPVWTNSGGIFPTLVGFIFSDAMQFQLPQAGSIVYLPELNYIDVVHHGIFEATFSLTEPSLCWPNLSNKDNCGTRRNRSQSLSQTSKGKMDKHIVTNSKITDDKLS